MDFARARGVILAETARALAGVDSGRVNHFCRLIMAAPRIFVTGEGRSGLMARAFAMRLMHLGYTAHVVGETTTPAIQRGDLLVAVSGSGETAITRHVLTQAGAAGARTALVSSRPDSSIGRAADFVLVVPGATKRREEGELPSEQPLGSLFDQAAHLTLDAAILVLGAGNEGGAAGSSGDGTGHATGATGRAAGAAMRHSNLE